MSTKTEIIFTRAGMHPAPLYFPAACASSVQSPPSPCAPEVHKVYPHLHLVCSIFLVSPFHFTNSVMIVGTGHVSLGGPAFQFCDFL